LPGRCLRQLREICSGANMAHLRTEHVFILQNYAAWKLSSAEEGCDDGDYPFSTISAILYVMKLTL
jgi:hypothetical protein